MKDIFSYNAEIEKNAYMNWRTKKHDPIGNMHVLAEGFFSSALMLAEKALEDNRDKKADMLIFPILFNVNHGIEVYLKSICWTLNKLLNKNATFIQNHDLKGLLGDLKTLEIEYENNTEFTSQINTLESYIDELYGKIKSINKKGRLVHDITFARYALNTDLEPQFYINELDNVVVDLENFLEVFQEIFKKLSNLSSHYQHKLETLYEMQAELNSEY